MKRTASQCVVAASFILWLLSAGTCIATAAETRPRYGGTLRLQLHDQVTSLDPADATASRDKDRLMLLVYDRLTALDEKGELQPQIALNWSADKSNLVWRLRI